MATTLLWTNAAAQLYDLTLFGNLETTEQISIKSCSYFVVPDYYNGDVYRDDFVSPDAAGAVLNQEKVGIAITPPIALIKLLEDGTETTKDVSVTGDDVFSGNDELMHIPPRPLKASRTMLYFWDGTVDVSNIAASCWMDEYKALTRSQVENIE